MNGAPAMNRNAAAYCDLLADKTRANGDTVQQVSVGLTWTACTTPAATGFAMSPREKSRTLSWPGTLAGRRASDLVPWLQSWDPFESAVGLAAANAVINAAGNSTMDGATPLEGGNLAVFEHFKPLLPGKKVVVVGRYPGLDAVLAGLDVTVLEREPEAGDLSDAAAEYVLPNAGWGFLTATSLMNKTFPRLAELSRGAVTVLMGPSTPWLPEWRTFGIDFLAGVRVIDRPKAWQIAIEGGGTRLFGEGVRYAVTDLRPSTSKTEFLKPAAR